VLVSGFVFVVFGLMYFCARLVVFRYFGRLFYFLIFFGLVFVLVVVWANCWLLLCVSFYNLVERNCCFFLLLAFY